MTPIFTFVAYSNTGKTTYVEKLIAELTLRGVRVGAVKHDAHDFDIDKPGKDSWRFARAGAQVVAVASGTKCAVMEYRPVGFREIVSRIGDVDVILVEGWHTEGENPIVLWRSDSGTALKLDPDGCFAVVSDIPVEHTKTPQFPLDDVRPLADCIMKKIGLTV